MMAPMRATHVFLVAFVSLSCASHRHVGRELPKPGEFVMRPLRYHLRDFRMDSGLRVLVQEDKSSAAVAVVMVVGAGSTDDDPGKEGLAHVVEHLTFRARPTSSM